MMEGTQKLNRDGCRNCSICAAPTSLAFVARVLGKHDVHYYYCAECGFLQTEPPYWLDEAYETAMAEEDVYVLARNLSNARKLAGLIHFSRSTRGAHLDWGGGYGLLTRLLRDIGIEAYWWDLHASNLFARGYERKACARPFSSVSAFELLEHLHNPMEALRAIFSETGADTLYFTTELFSDRPPLQDRWKYYAFNSGQHVSFYQARTLKAIADRLGLHFQSAHAFHAFSRVRLNALSFKVLTGPISHVIWNYVRFRRTSLLPADAAEARGVAMRKAGEPKS
jgi:hypothetical protein